LIFRKGRINFRISWRTRLRIKDKTRKEMRSAAIELTIHYRFREKNPVFNMNARKSVGREFHTKLSGAEGARPGQLNSH
jgi:hypothetical protein